jgi:hypothetical protein
LPRFCIVTAGKFFFVCRRRMEILLLNQVFYPDVFATAQHLSDLVGVAVSADVYHHQRGASLWVSGAGFGFQSISTKHVTMSGNHEGRGFAGRKSGRLGSAG